MSSVGDMVIDSVKLVDKGKGKEKQISLELDPVASTRKMLPLQTTYPVYSHQTGPSHSNRHNNHNSTETDPIRNGSTLLNSSPESAQSVPDSEEQPLSDQSLAHFSPSSMATSTHHQPTSYSTSQVSPLALLTPETYTIAARYDLRSLPGSGDYTSVPEVIQDFEFKPGDKESAFKLLIQCRITLDQSKYLWDSYCRWLREMCENEPDRFRKELWEPLISDEKVSSIGNVPCSFDDPLEINEIDRFTEPSEFANFVRPYLPLPSQFYLPPTGHYTTPDTTTSIPPDYSRQIITSTATTGRWTPQELVDSHVYYTPVGSIAVAHVQMLSYVVGCMETQLGFRTKELGNSLPGYVDYERVYWMSGLPLRERIIIQALHEEPNYSKLETRINLGRFLPADPTMNLRRVKTEDNVPGVYFITGIASSHLHREETSLNPNPNFILPHGRFFYAGQSNNIIHRMGQHLRITGGKKPTHLQHVIGGGDRSAEEETRYLRSEPESISTSDGTMAHVDGDEEWEKRSDEERESEGELAVGESSHEESDGEGEESEVELTAPEPRAIRVAFGRII